MQVTEFGSGQYVYCQQHSEQPPHLFAFAENFNERYKQTLLNI